MRRPWPTSCRPGWANPQRSCRSPSETYSLTSVWPLIRRPCASAWWRSPFSGVEDDASSSLQRWRWPSGRCRRRSWPRPRASSPRGAAWTPRSSWPSFQRWGTLSSRWWSGRGRPAAAAASSMCSRLRRRRRYVSNWSGGRSRACAGSTRRPSDQWKWRKAWTWGRHGRPCSPGTRSRGQKIRWAGSTSRNARRRHASASRKRSPCWRAEWASLPTTSTSRSWPGPPYWITCPRGPPSSSTRRARWRRPWTRRSGRRRPSAGSWRSGARYRAASRCHSRPGGNSGPPWTDSRRS